MSPKRFVCAVQSSGTSSGCSRRRELQECFGCCLRCILCRSRVTTRERDRGSSVRRLRRCATSRLQVTEGPALSRDNKIFERSVDLFRTLAGAPIDISLVPKST
eukprot:scaffold64470_cov46-Cyclotella_meneghiniana.AAC.1